MGDTLESISKQYGQFPNHIIKKAGLNGFSASSAPAPTPAPVLKSNEEIANEVINNCLKKVYDANYKNTRVTVDVNPNSMI